MITYYFGSLFVYCKVIFCFKSKIQLSLKFNVFQFNIKNTRNYKISNKNYKFIKRKFHHYTFNGCILYLV